MDNECFDELDFGCGVREIDKMLSVRWPDSVYLKLQYTWAYDLTIERDGYIFKREPLTTKVASFLSGPLFVCRREWLT